MQLFDYMELNQINSELISINKIYDTPKKHNASGKLYRSIKIKTMISQDHKNFLEEYLEVQLIPGLPQIRFLGFKESFSKESYFRIKSAIKSCGFKFPRSQQVIVNIRSKGLKWSLSGLELPVAIGVLLLTDQLPYSSIFENICILGDLSLNGDVLPIEAICNGPTDVAFVINGIQESILSLSNLKEINSEWIRKLETFIYENNKILNRIQNSKNKLISLNEAWKFTNLEAQFIFLSVVTDLSGCVFGQLRSGKSTILKIISDLKVVFQNNLVLQWPHHSISLPSFYKIHLHHDSYKKLIIMDDLLKFDSKIHAILKELISKEKWSVQFVKNQFHQWIHSNHQIISSATFCDCGKKMPNKMDIYCNKRNSKCFSKLFKLDKNFLDNLGFILFIENNENEVKQFSLIKIVEKIENYFAKSYTINIDEMDEDLNPNFEKLFTEDSYALFTKKLRHDSKAKNRNLIYVAKILTIEKDDTLISQKSLTESYYWTMNGFEKLNQFETSIL